ncbi:MAG TPA: creatininase family protein [Phycisphaerae bacterium]|nr:creatininase family protein [Phycisphaerae bacterium]HRR85391.1 creatininase family protein [Phycisphaerae bacterium]
MFQLLVVVATILGACAVTDGDQYLYEKMTPEQLKQAVVECPVAYLPTGIPEWHGEQNACGLDALKAETLGQMAAKMLGGICFPTVWTGPGGSTPFDPRLYPRGTVTIDEKLYQRQMEELLNHLESLGFKVAVHLSGHYPGVVPKLAEKFNQRGRMKVISASENQVVRGMPAGDHAAAWETSLLMVLRPGLVDLTRLPPLPEGVKPAGEKVAEPYQFIPTKEYYGVYGADPRVWANKTYGRRGTEAILEGLAREVAEALGDSSYGQKRTGIEWPGDSGEGSGVRYCHQLPYQWCERFDKAPIVYWPLVAAAESPQSRQSIMRGAEQLAVERGGMVFPAFSYAPSTDKGCVAVSAESFRQIVTEVVETLTGMGFRIVVLMPGRDVEPGSREALRAVKLPEEQGRVLVGDPGSGAAPRGLAEAIIATIPRQPSNVRLGGPWTIDGELQVGALAEQVSASPGGERIYETTFELSADQARMSAMLDLGQVVNLCEVVVNDSSPQVDHWPPYRLLVTGRLKPGVNSLKIVARNKPQPTLDKFFHTPGPPVLAGPVILRLWR